MPSFFRNLRRPDVGRGVQWQSDKVYFLMARESRISVRHGERSGFFETDFRNRLSGKPVAKCLHSGKAGTGREKPAKRRRTGWKRATRSVGTRMPVVRYRHGSGAAQARKRDNAGAQAAECALFLHGSCIYMLFSPVFCRFPAGKQDVFRLFCCFSRKAASARMPFCFLFAIRGIRFRAKRTEKPRRLWGGTAFVPRLPELVPRLLFMDVNTYLMPTNVFAGKEKSRIFATR